MTASVPTTCDVALPLPVDEPYTYRLPAGLADRVQPGARVVVPVRAREMVGVVVAVGDEDRDDLKRVLALPDRRPLVSPDLVTLAAWMSRYYAAPLGWCVKAMLPGALWGASQVEAELVAPPERAGGTTGEVVRALQRAGGRVPVRRIQRRVGRPVWDAVQRLERSGAVVLHTVAANVGPAPATDSVVRLVKRLDSLMMREAAFGRAHRQREAYDALDQLGGEASTRHLQTTLGFSRSVLLGLVERGFAVLDDRERVRDPFADIEVTPPPAPTPPQAEAIAAIHDAEPGTGVSLFGVTGSGKTLVYLRAMHEAVEAGRGAIVLVPEIALTPQTIARVRGAFGDTVAVLHSGLSDGERADAWRGLAEGARRVAVGARSAVFAPVRDLALIVVDEEHDGSYKNGETPRYHARDVARRRAQIAGARVVLGSATPSLETWAARDRIRVVALPTRIGQQPLPPVSLVDLRSAPQVKGSGPVPWTETLDDEVRASLERDEQVILLLNRRGFAHFLQCGACGVAVECPSCSIALTVHRNPTRLRCHYCGFDRTLPDACESCQEPTQRSRGAGTQLLERWLGERFPDARLARMDADTTATKWSHGRILDEVARRRVDVLLGTQMIAKGLDFPGVTLVGVVDADTGLYLPDFRAAERTFQLIAQVAGRAGRGPAGGRVVVQTRVPTHYALQTAAEHDFEGFAAQELAAREAPRYPPHVGLVHVVVSGGSERGVARGADEVATWLRALIADRGLDVDVLGPAPAPLARIKTRWRWHLILRGEDPRVLGRVLRYAAARAPHVRGRGMRVAFDRDPVSLL